MNYDIFAAEKMITHENNMKDNHEEGKPRKRTRLPMRVFKRSVLHMDLLLSLKRADVYSMKYQRNT
jgi:hypothetical protein